LTAMKKRNIDFRSNSKVMDIIENNDKFIVIFLGLNDGSPQELFNKIRECDTEGDWTHSKDDAWLMHHCENLIKNSKKIKDECAEFGFYYFDTFLDREKIFEEICDIIKKEQE